MITQLLLLISVADLREGSEGRETKISDSEKTRVARLISQLGWTDVLKKLPELNTVVQEGWANPTKSPKNASTERHLPALTAQLHLMSSVYLTINVKQLDSIKTGDILCSATQKKSLNFV